jgi:hypothetical protein
MTPLLPSLLTPLDVALWLNMPTSRVIRLARRREIPCLTLPDGELLFDPAELVPWVDRFRAREAVAEGRGAANAS